MTDGGLEVTCLKEPTFGSVPQEIADPELQRAYSDVPLCLVLSARKPIC